MIKRFGNSFVLSTDNTTYAMKVMPTGHVEHLYYGKRITVNSEEEIDPLVEKRGFAPCNTTVYACPDGSTFDPWISLEDVKLEMSSYGKSDIREPYIELVNPDGSFTSDFLFADAKILKEKPSYSTMPTSYFDESNEGDDANVLKLILKDVSYNLTLELIYSVFESSNVITRMTRLINESDSSIRIQRLMSNQLDFEDSGYDFHTFTGAWGREMHRTSTNVTAGKIVNSSYTGTSSNRANPFVMISDKKTDEDHGDVYGLNLVYSGNHYEALEVSAYGKTRFVCGINPQTFDYKLESGKVFEAPEAVMTFSNQGFNGMSFNMHRFVNHNIVRGEYKLSKRPILLNSWEACYFDINEERLLGLAGKAKEAGIELLVMDDGWFGKRSDDTKALGDWEVNLDKLPGGLKGLSEKVNKLGLRFGIWVEPEMINRDSDLYRKHPDWCISIPGKSHSEGRNQMLLDFTRDEVCEYIIEAMSKVFASGNISYVKWDMNRNFSDVYSQGRGKDFQGEVLHRYVLGFYRVAGELTKRFPKILFEGCASGGNRFDLGMLSYFPQIWASDDTDAYERVIIQNGYSYGYPQSAYTCHVSDSPNHQTTRVSPIETRFNVAAFGSFGYECNLNELCEDDFEAIVNQVAYYKEHREVLLYGDFYRGRAIPESNITEWTVVSPDKDEAMGFVMQNRSVLNVSMQKLYLKGINEHAKYEIGQRRIKYNPHEYGDFANRVNGGYHEQDSAEGYGDALMNAGVFLTQHFAGTGVGENMKIYQDLGSRIYHVKKME